MSESEGTSLAEQVAKLQEAQSAFETNATLAANHGVSLWSPDLVKFLAVTVLAFTLATVLISAVLLWRNRAAGFQILQVLGVVIIVGVSAVLLVVGYSNEQLTPIVGLFGAIAGYLLGKDKPAEVVTRPGDAPERSQAG